MQTQVYLLLVRNAGKWTKWSATPLFFKSILKDMIRGDSLDVPFVKFIRVGSINHSIEFGGSSTQHAYDQTAQKWVDRSSGTDPGSYEDSATHASQFDIPRIADPSKPTWAGVKAKGRAIRDYEYGNQVRAAGRSIRDYDYTEGVKSAGKAVGGAVASAWKGNDFADLDLPDHNNLVFTKSVDNATPQLAYGCSAQEAFPFAVFFFRRKIGPGVGGVRNPFLAIGLYKCKIVKWGLDAGLTETVELKYSNIAWCTIDMWADMNVPSGFSQRHWDTDKKSGGQTGPALALQLIVQVLSAAAAVAAGATADSGTLS